VKSSFCPSFSFKKKRAAGGKGQIANRARPPYPLRNPGTGRIKRKQDGIESFKEYPRKKQAFFLFIWNDLSRLFKELQETKIIIHYFLMIYS